MTTKKMLQSQFHISYPTVIRTLKACGLSTTQRWYSASEVALFAQARRLFQVQYLTIGSSARRVTAKAVTAYLKMKSAQSYE